MFKVEFSIDGQVKVIEKCYSRKIAVDIANKYKERFDNVSIYRQAGMDKILDLKVK
jgi:hypothetical protein